MSSTACLEVAEWTLIAKEGGVHFVMSCRVLDVMARDVCNDGKLTASAPNCKLGTACGGGNQRGPIVDRSMAWPPAKHHHQRGHSMGSGVREKDEDLDLFKDMGKGDKIFSVFPSIDDQLIHAFVSTKFGGLLHPQSPPPLERIGIGAELLNSDVDKTEYDWLMTPPGTPLFPSLNADSPVLQQGALINRSLAPITTSRVRTGPRSNSPAPNLSRGNPSTSKNGQSRSAGTRSCNPLPAKQASNNRSATPTRSLTPFSAVSPNLQARPSTATPQSSATVRPVTPLGAKSAIPTSRRPATPSSSGRPLWTPTLRRSSASPTGSQSGAGGSSKRNPSPARSTASTVTSARGVSPARSGSSPGVSPMRRFCPAPPRGLSPSPSLRAPYPVDVSNSIPSNLRTTSDRPNPAQHRAISRSAAPSLSSSIFMDRASRVASSDSESNFGTCSQSGDSNRGLVTPERSGSRRCMFDGGSDDYGRSSSLQKVRRSSTSHRFGPLAFQKSFESPAGGYHQGQVAAFHPLMTNNCSICTFYGSRLIGLLRRPLTANSTASLSERGAKVTYDREVDDENAASTWPLSNRQPSSGAHSPLHLFDKSLSDAAHETDTLDALTIVDNEERISFFRNPETLKVESLEVKCLAHAVSYRGNEESQDMCNVELNFLSGIEPVEDKEYLLSRAVEDVDINIANGAAGVVVQSSKQVPSCLDKIRDKLRHLKSSAEYGHAESASKVHQARTDTDSLDVLRAPAALVTVVDRNSLTIKPTEQQGTCELHGYRKQLPAGEGETHEP